MRARSDSIVSQLKRDHLTKLNYFYDIAQATIVNRQDPVTGLLPSLETGDQAWVRDNVYVATVLWGLSMGYRKLLDYMESKSRCYELQQAVVKLMRCLLNCMIQQRGKVEAFKHSLSPNDALHAKYSSKTTNTVVSDSDYGHLQLDATSLFLLMLAQMISSGVSIIFTLDEVAFVQNLIFYIQSAYMTPDFGIWERGDKTNHGVPELNSSSVGMAKAALEAMDELNLFGAEGGPQSVIHVSADFIVWCNDVIQAVLPRESTSKETDAALLSVITYPAFALDNMETVEKTKLAILTKLDGNYGIRRFLRDGYRCPREDSSRLYYEPSELKLFENLECEWPLFWLYLIIDGVFRGDTHQVDIVTEKLNDILLQDKFGYPLVPQLYAVPANRVENELASPGSENRIAGGSIPFDWGQSLYILAMLLREGLIAPGELDPLNRRLRTDPKPDTIVQVTILTDSTELKELFDQMKINIYMINECSPISVYPADLLQEVMSLLGCDERLELSGNPATELGILATSILYSMQDKILAFIPELFKEQNFYTFTDCNYLLDCFKLYLSIVEKNWSHKSGRPTVIFYLSSSLLDAEGKLNPAFISACKRISSGFFGGIRINYGRLADFLNTSCMSNLDFLTSICEISGSMSKYDYSCPCSKLCSQSSKLPDSTITNHLKSTPSTTLSYSPAPKSKKAKTLTEIRNSVKKSRMMMLTLETCPLDLVSTIKTVVPTSDLLITLKSQESIFPRIHSEPKHKNVEDVVALLSQSNDVVDQADFLYYLYIARGLGFQVELVDHTCLLADLIIEMYEKAIISKSWWLIRHTAGMLGYQAKSLSYALTSILIHNKQVSIGYPEAPFHEIVFTKPVTMERLLVDFKQACVDDVTMIVLTQEMLLSISAIISMDAMVFKEIIRIRIGLLARILIEELQRIHLCSYEDAHQKLYNSSPFELKHMLLSILTGRELESQEKSTGTRRVKGVVDGQLPLKPSKWLGSHAKSIAALDICQTDDPSVNCDKYGQWLRRRRIDGSLNRVPVAFYERIWQALDKCYGFTIADHHLSNSLTREMTREELKFAMEIEKVINVIPIPHYRQLIVEATLMSCLILQSNSKFFYKGTIDMDDIVYRASNLYRNDAVSIGVPEESINTINSYTYAGANRIVEDFFDCAPSGRYGTMNYMLRALFHIFNIGPEFEWIIDSSKF